MRAYKLLKKKPNIFSVTAWHHYLVSDEPCGKHPGLGDNVIDGHTTETTSLFPDRRYHADHFLSVKQDNLAIMFKED